MLVLIKFLIEGVLEHWQTYTFVFGLQLILLQYHYIHIHKKDCFIYRHAYKMLLMSEVTSYLWGSCEGCYTLKALRITWNHENTGEVQRLI
jgi:hypothetical protein